MSGNSIVALCRAGFEPECALDLHALADAADAMPAATCVSIPGVVTLAFAGALPPARLTDAFTRRPPIFAREIAVGAGPLPLGERDRITPIVAAASNQGVRFGARFGELRLEYPDTNDGKQMSSMCRRLDPLLRAALVTANLLSPAEVPRLPPHLPRLHVVFTSKHDSYVASSAPAWNSAWPMGIPRLKMPRDVPSRSTLKLAEAFGIFLSEEEQLRLLRPGLRAVDLGAAPGGWTWQLAHRGMRVTAVDNGPMKGSVADDSLVTHLREDGMTWRPKRAVDWLVCDIVLQPIRIAELVARWIADGAAKRAIFNLKLPMKKRYDEVKRCELRMLEITGRAGVNAQLRIRQLYHDREEVTGYLSRKD
ncbi:MAG: 23S rRNA (cytidine(2498)-2'-O)-methyltransferase RlmM [Betaproteobacteria bacterium]